MNNLRPFIPKEHPDLPDNYVVKITFVTGKLQEFELASHRLSAETGIFEFWTKDDKCNWIPTSSILLIEFDKNFSKMIAVKQKMDKEAKG